MKQWRKALNRVTFGITPTSLKRVEAMGWAAWVKRQLMPQADTACEARLKKLSYVIEKGEKEREVTVDFGRYFQSPQEIMVSLTEKDPDDSFFQAPALETALATWTRAVHSENQLFEVQAEFWHNHFNVSVDAEDEIALMFGVYDREVIRKHSLGNFRQFLEAVAKSPAMLFYLDNAFSQASPANENYARELFELHTLGAKHYYNHLYDDWKQVPGALEGRAEGYIDEDVYEAARAFTGWTVGDGREEEEVTFPKTGEFHYYDQWHDHYQKRILGQEFRSHQGPMDDGHKVLDLVAYHPGTALHLCSKLCRWYVADDPPQSLIDKAVATWKENALAEDQIARTIETILLSEEFEAHLETKIKRPNHLLLSFLRQTGLEIEPNLEWLWLLEQMGYRQFTWPVPTGHPDAADYWLNTDMVLKRWNSFPTLLYLNHEAGQETLLTDETAKIGSWKLDAVLDHWSERLLGRKLEGELRSGIKAKVMEEMEELPHEDLQWLLDEEPEALEYKLIQLVSLLAMLPEFQKR